MSVYGVANSTVGVYYVDVQYADDGGKKAYSNFKLIVTPAFSYNSTLLMWDFLMFTSATLCLCLYLLYLCQTNYSLKQKDPNQARKRMGRARKRFEKFQDIDIRYLGSGCDMDTNEEKTAVTYDY